MKKIIFPLAALAMFGVACGSAPTEPMSTVRDEPATTSTTASPPSACDFSLSSDACLLEKAEKRRQAVLDGVVPQQDPQDRRLDDLQKEVECLKRNPRNFYCR